jgi:dihydrofolate synthase / folylpolyglutamate synthase
MLPRLYALEQFGIKLGLSNIERLCEALGHPERSFASLHVAGTNGKGSVTAMAHAALVAGGVRAARYTSPHLTRLNERFVIGRSPIADDDLEAAAARVLDTADDLVRHNVLTAPPTFFEATTAIAFESFRRARVEMAVVEVGLGGRFDATNVITPIACAITSIALDHQEQLGNTLASVAFEKSGIIKAGVPVVVGSLPAEAAAVVQRVAEERAAPLTLASEAGARVVEVSDGRATIELWTPQHHYGPVTLALRGEHQVANAAVTVQLLEAARAAGFHVPFEAIESGLAMVEWPARLERLDAGSGRTVLVDAAHNPEGALALARYLQRWHPERPPLVFAAMRDKDVDGIARALLPACGAVVTTAPATRRAEDPDVLASLVRTIDPGRRVRVVPDTRRAVEAALEDGPFVCVAGSIFLAGEVRDALHGRAILP